jgi:EAL domain-containing protein (putative c-di-GMP-specific phosphodiesterase class I)
LTRYIAVSARQLSDPDLMLLVTSALARHGVPASQLVLEITETALMTDPVAAEITLSALAALGVRIAIDDFGTGYASLTYLQRFPVHELKIDRSFVESLVERPADRAIAGACVHLARALGLDCVAEGVETAEQRDVLLELGCDLAQGYLFSRPRPAGAHP